MSNFNCGSLFKLLCCPPLPSRIAAKLAFLPPEPSYKFQKINDISKTLSYTLSSKFTDIAVNFDPDKVDMFTAKTKRGNSIAIVFLNLNPNTKVTFLISHGNAVDIGLMLNFLHDLGSKLQVNIMCYDYSGYGESTGRPLESNLYADAECAINQLHTRYEVPFENIVLYGQSIGSVPTCHLATKFRVAAVVLHSPLLSGIRVPFPEVKKTYCCDVFTNIAKAPKFISPTLVIHGTRDEVIGFAHGVTLYSSIPRKMRLPPLFLNGAGHNNCESYSGYLNRLQQLVRDELPDLIDEAAISNAEIKENANDYASNGCIPFKTPPPCMILCTQDTVNPKSELDLDKLTKKSKISPQSDQASNISADNDKTSSNSSPIECREKKSIFTKSQNLQGDSSLKPNEKTSLIHQETSSFCTATDVVVNSVKT